MDYENRRPLVLGAVVLGVVIVLVGTFLIFRDKGVTLIVTPIPNDQTLTVDGQPVVASNGEIKVKSGTHTLTGERRGFQTYSTTFKAGSGDELKVKMYLYANSSEGRDWARDNPDQERELEAEAGRQAGKSVGVCGEAAADPMLACALVGMGITSLSMAAAAVRPVGAQLGKVSSTQCEEAAEAALAASDPMAARDAARAALGL